MVQMNHASCAAQSAVDAYVMGGWRHPLLLAARPHGAEAVAWLPLEPTHSGAGAAGAGGGGGGGGAGGGRGGGGGAGGAGAAGGAAGAGGGEAAAPSSGTDGPFGLWYTPFPSVGQEVGGRALRGGAQTNNGRDSASLHTCSRFGACEVVCMCMCMCVCVFLVRLAHR